MNYGPLIFLGLLCTMWFSWYGFLYKNYKDLGAQGPAELPAGGTYPYGRTSLATLGQEVYQANGCAACHTMQVRMKGYGADIERGFGVRNTVLRDFIYDENVFLGQLRLGPDLSNAGIRNPNPDWHLVHLYEPRALVKGSTMPQYKFLFEKRRIRGYGASQGLIVPQEIAPEPGYEIVPTREARALAAYMVSLRADQPIFEAPIIAPPTNRTEGASAPEGTNGTNNAPDSSETLQ